MNLRRLLACGLATASLAGGVGSTVLVGHAATPPATHKLHKQKCTKPVPGQPLTANTCKPKPKKHHPKTTHSPKPKPTHSPKATLKPGP
jgi:hypothetical protein